MAVMTRSIRPSGTNAWIFAVNSMRPPSPGNSIAAGKQLPVVSTETVPVPSTNSNCEMP